MVTILPNASVYVVDKLLQFAVKEYWLKDLMKILLLMVSLLAPTIATADTSYFWTEEEDLANYFDSGVMHVNDRKFLMGDLHDWPLGSDDYSVSFILRSSIRLRELLVDDAVLKYQDFEIRRTRDSSHTGSLYFEGQMASVPSYPMSNPIFYYKTTLDPRLQVQGYDTYFNGSSSLHFMPQNSDIAHGFRCYLDLREGQPFGELNICSVVIVYPYATNIVLNGSRIRPGTISEYGLNFRAIAERMLEIVTCIDITENQSAELPNDLSQLLEGNPNLTDCRIELTG